MARLPGPGAGVSVMVLFYCDLINDELIGRMEMATLSPSLWPTEGWRSVEGTGSLRCSAPVRPVGTDSPGRTLRLFLSLSLPTAELMARHAQLSTGGSAHVGAGVVGEESTLSVQGTFNRRSQVCFFSQDSPFPLLLLGGPNVFQIPAHTCPQHAGHRA